jgi:hypothetical protein
MGAAICSRLSIGITSKPIWTSNATGRWHPCTRCMRAISRARSSRPSGGQPGSYDAWARADPACYLAAAGKTDRGIELLEDSIRSDAKNMDWYFGNPAIAYSFADRPADSVAHAPENEVTMGRPSGSGIRAPRQAGRGARQHCKASRRQTGLDRPEVGSGSDD